MHSLQIFKGGKPIENASKALILLHGRGASAADILSLGDHLQVSDFALWAPQATGHSWYPQSFMAPVAANEPWLSSALDMVHKTRSQIEASGISAENIYFLGFSQGACLTMEYIARHGQKYGGAVAFTGGLIGESLDTSVYQGHFKNTPIFIGSSDPDFHVPVTRVKETTAQLQKMGAQVTEKIYPNMPHTISQDEIDMANQLIFTSPS